MTGTKIAFVVQEPNSDKLQIFLVSKIDMQKAKNILSKNPYASFLSEMAKHGISAESVESIFYDPACGFDDNI